MLKTRATSNPDLVLGFLIWSAKILTLQFTAVGGALALIHEAVVVVVEEAVGL